MISVEIMIEVSSNILYMGTALVYRDLNTGGYAMKTEMCII